MTNFTRKKSQIIDTLGPIEVQLIVWPGHGNQGDKGDRREQDNQGEASIIIFSNI